MKTSDVVGQFGKLVKQTRSPVSWILIALIVINYAPTEVLGTQLDSQLRSMLGPILNPIQGLMRNVFVRLFLWLLLLWSCCFAKDMTLFFLVVVYFLSAGN